jgi:hypothetical protein
VSVTNTVLIYVGIPALIVLVIAGFSMMGGRASAKRYRPGRPFQFAPVWFLSAPERVTQDQGGKAELTGAQRAELVSADASDAGVTKAATGGASDSW